MKHSDISRGFSANAIKWMAYLAMLLDHVAFCFLPTDSPLNMIFRVLGRIAAPVMCYFIAEGYAHTSDLRRYMGRLALMAVVSHVPYALCFGYTAFWRVWEVTSVIWSLLMGLVALTFWDRFAIPKHPFVTWAGRFVILGICCLLAYSADWNYIAVFWVVAFGALRGDKNKQAVGFAIGAGLYLLQTYRSGLLLTRYFPLGIVLFLPLLYAYNGTLGKKSKTLKWAGYWFYPVHLILLYLLTRLCA